MLQFLATCGNIHSAQKSMKGNGHIMVMVVHLIVFRLRKRKFYFFQSFPFDFSFCHWPNNFCVCNQKIFVLLLLSRSLLRIILLTKFCVLTTWCSLAWHDFNSSPINSKLPNAKIISVSLKTKDMTKRETLKASRNSIHQCHRGWHGI